MKLIYYLWQIRSELNRSQLQYCIHIVNLLRMMNDYIVLCNVTTSRYQAICTLPFYVNNHFVIATWFPLCCSLLSIQLLLIINTMCALEGCNSSYELYSWKFCLESILFSEALREYWLNLLTLLSFILKHRRVNIFLKMIILTTW